VQVCWRVACYFPGGTLVVLSILNVFLWASGSSGAIPLGFFFSVLFLW
jgi:transmembrane 9 superfamily protein 2/4